MKRKGLWISLAVVGFVLSSIGGVYLGSNSIAKTYLTTYLRVNLTSLDSNLKVVELLKKNENEKAEELLETLIDVDLAALSEQVLNKTYAKNRDEIIQTIHKAKDYRSKWPNPNHSINKNLRNGVENAFKL